MRRSTLLVLVVDASALLEVVVGVAPDGDLVARLAGSTLHAPHLLDTEVLHVLRSLRARSVISDRRANDARDSFGTLTITRYPHDPLNDRVWELRNNLSAYDATYVALAEWLRVPLVTTDARIGRVRRLRTDVEVYPTT